MGLLKYRPEIDGLRAIAVIPVILFHLSVDWIPGGFVGVDVFFVISGYLITTIVVQEYDQGEFTFLRFWLRRFRRIIPALVVMVIVTSLAGVMQFFRSDENDLGLHGISAILSFANITMWRVPGGYWGARTENSLFLHTWSLSVEEQFYLLYPALLICLLKLGRKWTSRALLVLISLSFALYVYGSKHSPAATFYLLPTRAWELATGCLVAMAALASRQTLSNGACSAFSFVGLLAITLSCITLYPEYQFSGCLAIPVVGAALIIWCGDNRSNIVNRILSYPPLVFIGKISYSLYLWHWPIAVFARQRIMVDGSVTKLVFVLAIIALVSILSFRFIEQPTRRRANLVAPVSFAVAISLCLSSWIYMSSWSLDFSAYSEVVWAGDLYNVGLRPILPEVVKNRMDGVVVFKRAENELDAYKNGGIIKQYGLSTPEIVVLGDSHALMWGGVIDSICEEMGITVSFYAADGEPPFMQIPLVARTFTGGSFSIEERQIYDAKRLESIAKWRPRLVIFAARWAGINGKASTEDLIHFIGENGAKILLIEQPPNIAIGDKNALNYVASAMCPKEGVRQFADCYIDSHDYRMGYTLIRQLCQENPFCSVVPIADLFYTPALGCCILDGLDILYIDDNHLSRAGALKCKARIQDAIKATLLR